MLKLTEEEQVYAYQLFSTRKAMAQLQIEEATQSDRLLSILRGHRTHHAEGGGFLVSNVIMDSRECILISSNGRLPHEM